VRGEKVGEYSLSSCSMALRNTIRPMRPKPLIPTLTGMIAKDVLADGEGILLSKRSSQTVKVFVVDAQELEQLLQVLRR
jgi:hypothetical protein